MSLKRPASVAFDGEEEESPKAEHIRVFYDFVLFMVAYLLIKMRGGLDVMRCLGGAGMMSDQSMLWVLRGRFDDTRGDVSARVLECMTKKYKNLMILPDISPDVPGVPRCTVEVTVVKWIKSIESICLTRVVVDGQGVKQYEKTEGSLGDMQEHLLHPEKWLDDDADVVKIREQVQNLQDASRAWKKLWCN